MFNVKTESPFAGVFDKQTARLKNMKPLMSGIGGYMTGAIRARLENVLQDKSSFGVFRKQKFRDAKNADILHSIVTRSPGYKASDSGVVVSWINPRLPSKFQLFTRGANVVSAVPAMTGDDAKVIQGMIRNYFAGGN